MILFVIKNFDSWLIGYFSEVEADPHHLEKTKKKQFLYDI